MDDHRFDALTRALGGASTRRTALGALAGLLAGGAAVDADAKTRKKKRKRCTPACPSGQTCRQGTCTCDNGGAVCGTSCCRTGQRCEDGICVGGDAGGCVPNVGPGDSQGLLDRLATGDALLPAGSTYAFTAMEGPLDVAIRIEADRTIRACGGTATIACDGPADSFGWRCIRVEGRSSLHLDGIHVTSASGTAENQLVGVRVNGFYGPASLTLERSRITGFSIGLFDDGGRIDCPVSGNAICGNHRGNCMNNRGTSQYICTGCSRDNDPC